MTVMWKPYGRLIAPPCVIAQIRSKPYRGGALKAGRKLRPDKALLSPLVHGRSREILSPFCAGSVAVRQMGRCMGALAVSRQGL